MTFFEEQNLMHCVNTDSLCISALTKKCSCFLWVFNVFRSVLWLYSLLVIVITTQCLFFFIQLTLIAACFIGKTFLVFQ